MRHVFVTNVDKNLMNFQIFIGQLIQNLLCGLDPDPSFETSAVFREGSRDKHFAEKMVILTLHSF